MIRRIWRMAPTREARNEQKKAGAAFLNAMAIALFVAGLFGPALNPALEGSLTPFERLVLVFGGIVGHILVRMVLWSVEDK